MPRFNPDPSKVTIGFPVYPKGDYLVELSEPKTFYRPGKSNDSGGTKADNYGVAFSSSKIAEGEFKGKLFSINCMMHTDGSQGFSKIIQMAALGFNPKNKADIKKFDETEGLLDWSFDTDANTVGDAWHKMKGKIVKVTVETKMDMSTGTAEEVQDVKGYSPA